LFSVAFSLDDSCVMPFHAMSLGFWMKTIKPATVTSHDDVKKVVTFDSTPFQQLREHFFAEVCASLSASAESTR
jgi:uncharacterized protein YeaO (DUF488 family)